MSFTEASQPRQRKSVSADEAEREHELELASVRFQHAVGKVRAVNIRGNGNGVATPRDSFGDFDANDGFIQSPRMSLSGRGQQTMNLNAGLRLGGGFQAALEQRLHRVAGSQAQAQTQQPSVARLSEDAFALGRDLSFAHPDAPRPTRDLLAVPSHGKSLYKTFSVDVNALNEKLMRTRSKSKQSKRAARESRAAGSKAGGLGSRVRRSSFAVLVGGCVLAATGSLAPAPTQSLAEGGNAAGFGFDFGVVQVEARSAAAKAPVLITDEMREEYTSDFVAFDSDRNNVLDAQEVTANFQGQVKPREMHEFFRTADKNMDGKVSLAEYVDYAADLSAENQKQEL